MSSTELAYKLKKMGKNNSLYVAKKKNTNSNVHTKLPMEKTHQLRSEKHECTHVTTDEKIHQLRSENTNVHTLQQMKKIHQLRSEKHECTHSTVDRKTHQLRSKRT